MCSAQLLYVCHSLEGEGGKTAPDLGLGINPVASVLTCWRAFCGTMLR